MDQKQLLELNERIAKAMMGHTVKTLEGLFEKNVKFEDMDFLKGEVIRHVDAIHTKIYTPVVVGELIAVLEKHLTAYAKSAMEECRERLKANDDSEIDDGVRKYLHSIALSLTKSLYEEKIHIKDEGFLSALIGDIMIKVFRNPYLLDAEVLFKILKDTETRNKEELLTELYGKRECDLTWDDCNIVLRKKRQEERKEEKKIPTES